MVNTFEKVYYYDYYDGPISGVADKNGKAHYFEYQGYMESAKECYCLSPISEELLQLAMESWAIWKRWDIAFHRGKVDISTHPYLEKDRKRGEHILAILDKRLKIDEANYVELDTEFEVAKNQKGIVGQKQFMVKWKELK